MDAVILCGGRGTRLSEKTKVIPKPLVEIGDYPILWHIMKYLSHYGHNRFLLSLGYKGDMIKHWFLNHRFSGSFDLNLQKPELPPFPEDWTIHFKNTGLDSGTGYRLKQAFSEIKSKRFILLYGDCIADVDMNALIKHHEEMVRKHGIAATISGYQPLSKYGIINHTTEGLITEFIEKPRIKEWVNIGFMVCEKSILDHLSDDQSSMFEHDILHSMATEKRLALYKHTGVFYPMDTYKDYVELNSLWKSGNAPWKVWKN